MRFAVCVVGYVGVWVLSAVPFLPGLLFKLNRYTSLSGWGLWAAGVPVFFFGARAIARRTHGCSLADLGLGRHTGWLHNLACGIALGATWIAIDFAIGIAAGRFTITGFAPLPDALLAAFLLVVNFAFVAVSEELVHRGFLLRCLEGRLPRGWSVAAATVVFALVHVPQQGAAPLYMISLLLMGLLFVETYLLTGSLWLGIGLHWAVNTMGWMLIYTNAVVIKQHQPAGLLPWIVTYVLAVVTIVAVWLLRGYFFRTSGSTTEVAARPEVSLV